MLNTTLITVKTKKLGVLLRDARLKKNRTLEECADALGITPEDFDTYEQGKTSPSLPELEVLAFFLNIPLQHFLLQDTLWQDKEPQRVRLLDQLIDLRQRTIGAIIRKGRQEAGISLEAMADDLGVNTSEMEAFETGRIAVSLPVLEYIASMLNLSMEEFQDHKGPIGRWSIYKQATEEVAAYPGELQSFIANPKNRPYIEIAQQLSLIPNDQIRQLAENLWIVAS